MSAGSGQARTLPDEGVVGAGLRLSSFRAVRPDVDGPALAARLSPPGDLLVPGLRDDLLARDPYNVVRLILARPERAGGSRGADDPGLTAQLLRRWRSEGRLRGDPTPSLYVLQMPPVRAGGRPVRGLLGVLRLDAASDLTLLPHEDVMDEAVRDRAEELRQTGADLEPLLAIRSGHDLVGHVLADPARYARPLADAGDGHRLWSVDEPALCHDLSVAVAGAPLLVADGHHRLAAHELLRRTGATQVPSSVLALVVEQGVHGLELGAIHRVLPGVPTAAVLAAAAAAGLSGPRDGPVEGPHAHVRVVGAGGMHELHPATSAGWLPVEVVEPLVAPYGAAVRYERNPIAAAELAASTGGTAVLLEPPPLAQLMAAVRTGRRLPRKSTSFEPKPPTGLALRCYDLPDGDC